MRETNTVTDFTRYLSARELLIREEKLLLSPSEAELVANYQLTTTDDGHHTFPTTESLEVPSEYKLSFVQGEYAEFLKSGEYSRRLLADRPSYVWDKLISQFTESILGGTSYAILGVAPDTELAERALRFMARETRLARRMLGESFLGAISGLAASDQNRFARIVLPNEALADPKLAYVFMVLSEGPWKDYEDYRAARASMLETYCYAILHDDRSLERCVGIAIDALDNSGCSEDLMAVQQLEWTDEEVSKVREAREGFEILVDPERLEKSGKSFREFPLDPNKPKISRQQRRAAERNAKKARQKMGWPEQ